MAFPPPSTVPINWRREFREAMIEMRETLIVPNPSGGWQTGTRFRGTRKWPHVNLEIGSPEHARGLIIIGVIETIYAKTEEEVENIFARLYDKLTLRSFKTANTKICNHEMILGPEIIEVENQEWQGQIDWNVFVVWE